MPGTKTPIVLALKCTYTLYINHSKEGLFIRKLLFCCIGNEKTVVFRNALLDIDEASGTGAV